MSSIRDFFKMQFHVLPAALLVMLPIVSLSCGGGSDMVLSKSKMTRLLRDIHKAESYMEINRKDFTSDSMRKVLRQSVLAENEVSEEQWDSSLTWYGNHIEDYVEVYDKVISDLESELKVVDVADASGQVQLELFGDSVNAWPYSRTRLFNWQQPTDFMKFNLKKDSNWEAGDVYTWRFYTPLSTMLPIRWTMSAEYTDGTIDYTSGSLSGQGWHMAEFITDSIKIPASVRGVVEYRPMDGENFYVDSISLYRTRTKESNYPRSSVETFYPNYYRRKGANPAQSR